MANKRGERHEEMKYRAKLNSTAAPREPNRGEREPDLLSCGLRVGRPPPTMAKCTGALLFANSLSFGIFAGALS